MSVAVVTSCSAAGYKHYGLRMLDSFHTHWPVEVPIFFVSEDVLGLPASITGGARHVIPVNLTESMTGPMRDFYARHATNLKVRGSTRRSSYSSARTVPYNFRLDAWKFSKKVFSIALAAERTSVDRLIWLDADTITFKAIPMTFLQELPPGQDHALACLDRASYHSECGFVSYKLAHPDARPFITEFARLYTSDEVFKLKEWHDSFVFDHLRKRTRIPTFKIPHTHPGHPFVHSCLGIYMDHLKGTFRKDQGVSKDHPRFKKR